MQKNTARQALVALFSFLAASTAASAASPEFEQLQAVVAQQCQNSKLKVPMAQGTQARQAANASVSLMCECMPQEVERRVGVNPALREVSSQQEAQALLQAAARSCGAAQVKKDLTAACLPEAKQDKEITDPKTYCACLKAKVDAVPNDDLANDSERAYREFQERVQARQNNQALPERTPSIIEGLSAACKTQAKR